MTSHTETQTRRGGFLTAMAICLALAATVDLLKAFTNPPSPGQKPFGMQMPPPGLVVLGAHHTGWDETILGVLLATFLSFYAVGVWRMKRYAVTLGWVYAAYVILNVTLFTAWNPAPPTPGAKLFAIVYCVVAIVVTVGTATALTRRSAELG